jgi:carbon monoxide dehydrogenase subunit G
MRLEQSFEVPVPVAQAWNVLLDLERVAPCMPGATLTTFDGTAFTGTVKVKLGPISLAYRGQGRITERDELGRRVAFVAQGQDSRGAGGASARVSAVLHSADGGAGTLVRVVTDLDISGKAAQFGRGMVADVSGKVIKQFADNLAAVIGSAGPTPAPAAVPAVSIPAQATAVDALPPATPPALAPIFTEPSPTPPAPPTPPTPPVAPVFPPPPVGWEPPETPPPAAPETTQAAPETTQAAPETPPAPAPAPEPTAEYVPPTPAHSGPPEYHPLALQEPVEETYTPPTPPTWPQPAAAPLTPTAAEPPAVPAPGTGLRQPPVEAEPLDLLAVSGAKGMLRRAAPVLIIVALALAGLVVWLVAGR